MFDKQTNKQSDITLNFSHHQKLIISVPDLISPVTVPTSLLFYFIFKQFDPILSFIRKSLSQSYVLTSYLALTDVKKSSMLLPFESYPHQMGVQVLAVGNLLQGEVSLLQVEITIQEVKGCINSGLPKLRIFSEHLVLILVQVLGVSCLVVEKDMLQSDRMEPHSPGGPVKGFYLGHLVDWIRSSFRSVIVYGYFQCCC